MNRILIMLFFLSALLGCEERATAPDSNSASLPSPIAESAVSRWYTDSQSITGREVFAQNCAVCHGAQAEGTAGDWREKLDDGSFPPPPLNGTAHAWHHPQEILLRVIDYGGEAMGGKMPAFIDVLDQQEKLAAIAFFQSFWTDAIYQQWMQMGGTN
ncbi:MAG: cytochrome c [Pseudohongiellaceae bacterium]